MKRNKAVAKKRVFLWRAAVVLGVLSLVSCGNNRESDELAQRLLDLESPAEAAEQAGTNARLAELQDQVNHWRDELNRTLEASQNLAYYHKLLGLKYMDFESYKLAHESFKAAIEIQPENAILHYRAGVSAGRMALSVPDEPEQQQWLERADFYYRRAVDLSPRYKDALYALAVLCFYELDRPGEAEVFTERLLAEAPLHPRGLFLRANIHVRAGQVEEAVAVYDQIIESSQADEYIRQAEQNKKKLLLGWTGE